LISRRLASLTLLTLIATLCATPSPGQAPAAGAAGAPAHAAPKVPAAYYDGVPDTGQFLPDTTVLGRMNDRVIRIRDFVETFYSSYAEYRPRPDSAGRVQFLNTMIDKEVLAQVARQAKRPMGFEDRMVMAEHTTRVLSNVLFQRMVLDSIPEPSEAEIRRIYDQYAYELHLQVIVMRERDAIERVRRDLVARRLTWPDAAKKFSTLRADSFPDGDIGWRRRKSINPSIATAVFDLKAGDFSPVLPDYAGYALYRGVERRPIPPISYPPMRSMIRDEMRNLGIGERGSRIMAALRERVGMTYDVANIAWAASQFAPAVSVSGDITPTVEVDMHLPHFEPADTSRVVARWNGGHMSLGTFVTAYSATSPLTRPTITTAEAFANQVDRFALEPYRADLARERGLDRDPMAIAMIEKRREQVMVEHLYEDSILPRVQVSRAERRRYYQQNLAQFISYANVTYARFHVDRRTEADSIVARLKAGEHAADILKTAGRDEHWGSIEEQREDVKGTRIGKILFEELRPGQVMVDGPDSEGHFEIIQSLSFDPGHQLPFEEVETPIDESLQNIGAEKLLKAMIARNRRKARIETRPELVMLIRLVDPATR
jgi:parvulin-like peptidyl-prolyl cis-trans isomerase-like protein/PPIC-type peptidyl-prolyl cis-trans isomerase-like protein